jgi:hypothetical protein
MTVTNGAISIRVLTEIARIKKPAQGGFLRAESVTQWNCSSSVEPVNAVTEEAPP